YARANASSGPLYQATIESLALLGGTASRNALDGLTQGDRPVERRLQAVVALASLDLEAAARRAVQVLGAADAATDPVPVFNVFLQRKNGATVLAAALANHKLP